MTASAPVVDYSVARPSRWRRAQRWVFTLSATSVLLAGLAYAGWWWAVLRPYWKLEAMLTVPEAQTASPAEFRAAAHAALRFPGSDPHDAFLVLIQDGDQSSVPLLIRSLRWQAYTPPNGAMVCTKAHCLEALRKLTGRNLGSNYEDWAPLLGSP